MTTTSTVDAPFNIVPPQADSDKLLFRVFDHAMPIGYARLKKIKAEQQKPDAGKLPYEAPLDCAANYELRMIEVAQNYRRRGVGSFLLREVIRYCRESNVAMLTGEIKGDVRTLRHWYRQNGFSVNQDDKIALMPAVSL